MPSQVAGGRVTVETVGPAKARRLLAKLMPRYRSADEEQVETYARMMREGAWRGAGETGGGDPLTVDDVVGLVNGRRRLMAVVRSGTPVRFVVLRGRFELFEPPEEN